MAQRVNKIFFSDGRSLHEAVEAVFASELKIVRSRKALDDALGKAKRGLVLLDAEYGASSGYAICEDIKARKGENWRVHLISNEVSVGENEKAIYAGVDRLFIVPKDMGELLKDE